MRSSRSLLAAAVALASLLGVACSSSSGSSKPTTPPSIASAPTTATSSAATVTIATVAPTTAASDAPTTTVALTTDIVTTDAPTTTVVPETTAPPKPINILVTNDDGYDAAGIDAVVEYLRTLPAVTVSVVAPATNQSGAGDKTTPGGATTITDVTTLSGYPAKAVVGFPADSVNWALNGGLATKPDLVVSGSNLGQNYGTLITISGTIGAAATAARAGIPAIAISQGFATAPQTPYFPASITVLGQYLTDSLDAYRNGDGVPLVSINVPTCPDNKLFPTLTVLPATNDADRGLGAPATCDGPLAGAPKDDIEAFNAGHATLSYLDPTTLAGEPSPG